MAMPMDNRLRNAFDRAASTVDADVERHLEQTIRRDARRRTELPLGPLLAASAVVLALVVSIRLLGAPSSGPGGIPATPGPSGSGPGAIAALAGGYTVTLLDSDPGIVTAGLVLSGTWSMTVHPSGVVDVVPPETFEGSRAAGHTFSLDGTTLRTDLYYNDYCGSIGTYTWDASGERLVLTVVDDGCGIRRTVLATRAWVRRD
jgi:hypothetical protein